MKNMNSMMVDIYDNKNKKHIKVHDVVHIYNLPIEEIVLTRKHGLPDKRFNRKRYHIDYVNSS